MSINIDEQAAERQEVLFLLAKEFNDSKEMQLAKQMLGYSHVIINGNNQDKHIYLLPKLGEILKNQVKNFLVKGSYIVCTANQNQSNHIYT